MFGGSRDGYLYALAAMTGQPLWRFQTGGQFSADAISFEVEGRQHVAIAAGQAIFVFAIKAAERQALLRRIGR